MAQGSIRKGFFFYFGLFVLLLVTVFLICLVIMMFNPGKTVLWMKYFSSDKVIQVSKTTDNTEMNINYENLTDVTIKCGFANVTVQRNNEYKADGIYIRNKSKGFAGAKNYSAFSYKATLDGTKLTLDVSEPNGFLYFSKDIEIIVNDCVAQNGWNLGSIGLTVEADGDSDIYLGGTTIKNEEAVSLRFAKLTTDKGNITLGQRFNTSSISDVINPNSEEDNFGIRLYTGSGSIKASNTVAGGLKTGSGIYASKAVSLGTTKGRINLDILSIGNNKVEIRCKKGTVAIDDIYASEVSVSNCVNGNFRFKNVNSDMTFAQSQDSIISPIISIEHITGEFRLVANTHKTDAPIVNIKNIDKKLSVTAGKGSVTVSNANGEVDVRSLTSMAVKITVAKNNSNKIRIENNKGKTYLKFLGVVSSEAVISSNKGNIDIDFTKNANFSANCLVKDSATTPLAKKYVHVNLGKDEVSYEEYDAKTGVITFGGETNKGSIKIDTNDDVYFNLVKVAA